ncbi:response regulator [Clostridium paraputrificum]|uniref:response regulator n=1 Tax=Clostridium paraputrificum TaxID=29363 RepID=UPI003D33355F
MNKVLFLLNDSLKYKDLILKLIDSKVMVNVLDSFTSEIINSINEIDYNIILIEDDPESRFQVNSIRLLSRKEKKKYLILISDYEYKELEKDIDEIIQREKLLENYDEFFKKYDIHIRNKTKTIDSYEKDLDGLGELEDLKRIKKKLKNSEKNIIIVDDDEISISILGNILIEEGYKVTSFKSGIDALKEIKKYLKNKAKVDMFILDLMMPVMDGFTLLRRLRSYMKFKETPVLITSVRSDVGSVKQVARHGVKGYLLKPYNKDLILSRIDSCIE